MKNVTVGKNITVGKKKVKSGINDVMAKKPFFSSPADPAGPADPANPTDS